MAKILEEKVAWNGLEITQPFPTISDPRVNRSPDKEEKMKKIAAQQRRWLQRLLRGEKEIEASFT